MNPMRAAKKEINAIRKRLLFDNLKVGAFVKNVWGATMQRVSYMEIVSIEKNRVGLVPAKIIGDPSPNCSTDTVTLIGPHGFTCPTNYAVCRMGYLVKEGASLTDNWSKYEFVKIGDSTMTWSD